MSLWLRGFIETEVGSSLAKVVVKGFHAPGRLVYMASEALNAKILGVSLYILK